jgi:sialidase-1
MMCGKILCGFSILIIAVTLVCYTNVAKAQVVKEGLVSHWTFDQADIEGTTVKDVQGSNDGSIEGEPKTVEGRTGDALSFDGVADHIVVPNDDSMNFGAGDFTVCAWVKTTATTGGGSSRDDIVAKGDPSISGYGLASRNSACLFFTANLGEFQGTSPINDDEWHYLVGVRVSSDTFLYVDGEVEANGTNSENVDTTLNLIIGKHPMKAESYITGAIDDVCIYNRALSEDEVKQNYEAEGAAVESAGKLSLTWGKIKALVKH